MGTQTEAQFPSLKLKVLISGPRLFDLICSCSAQWFPLNPPSSCHIPFCSLCVCVCVCVSFTAGLYVPQGKRPDPICHLSWYPTASYRVWHIESACLKFIHWDPPVCEAAAVLRGPLMLTRSLYSHQGETVCEQMNIYYQVGKRNGEK